MDNFGDAYTCEVCTEEVPGPEILRLTLTTLHGVVLDVQKICRGCAVLIGLSPGK